MSSKWARRFYDNIDPSSNERGFDGLGNLEKKPINEAIINKKRGKSEKEKERLKFRMDELKDRISLHAGITTTFSLPLSCLAWNKNPQCPQRTWECNFKSSTSGSTEEAPTEGKYDSGTGYYCIDAPSRKFVPRLCSWDPINKKDSPQGWIIKTDDRRLVVPRHTYYEYTLWASDYVENYFPKSYQDGKHIIAYGVNVDTGFWLIDASEADFVYAILKSSMFRAWCELTEYDGGAGHFTVGMWDTFPIQDTTMPLSNLPNQYLANMFKREGGAMTVEGAISCAGHWLSRNVWKQHSPTLSFDECMDELCGFGPASTSPYSGKQILAKGFSDMDIFPSLRNDVMSLA